MAHKTSDAGNCRVRIRVRKLSGSAPSHIWPIQKQYHLLNSYALFIIDNLIGLYRVRTWAGWNKKHMLPCKLQILVSCLFSNEYIPSTDGHTLVYISTIIRQIKTILGPSSKTSPVESLQPLCTKKNAHSKSSLLKSRAKKLPTPIQSRSNGRYLMFDARLQTPHIAPRGAASDPRTRGFKRA